MNRPNSKPDAKSILDDAWGHVVGGIGWMRAVLFGEFVDNRPLSAVIADMLVSFVPGVVIVTSARDAVAVILRLAHHPEKREERLEWILLCACLIVIALPLAMAVGGAVGAGVGAAVGGIVGSELGAALRAGMLLLIKKSSKLVDVVLFLQKFIKGDVLKFLRAVTFAKYEKALVQALNKIIGKLIGMVSALRSHLESLRYFDSVKTSIEKLAEWERKFYNVQHDALVQIPKALVELDARLAKVLTEALPKEAHTITSGVQAEKKAATIPPRQRVRDAPGKFLVKVEDDLYSAAQPTAKLKSPTKGAPLRKPEPPLKDKPDPVKSPDETANTKKQATVDAAIAEERARITKLSNEGKIGEAREVLQPYVDAAKNAKTADEKRAAMQAIIERLDVSSEKEKMFWSGNKELARKIAKEKGKVILEETAGGKVIDEWEDLSSVFTWNPKDLEPHGWDLWGDVSENYTKGVFGEVDVIQDIKKFPGGGETWKTKEWEQIFRERKVSMLNIFGMDKAGNVVEIAKMDPYGQAAIDIFRRRQ